MVLNPKKKSKRGSLKSKYVAQKKGKESVRRLRKMAKKARLSGAKRYKRADPGIPNTWPFKTEELQAVVAAKNPK